MFHYNCDTCDLIRHIDMLPREYVFPDGRVIHMLQRHIWCTTCNTITVAEALKEDPATYASMRATRDQHQTKLERDNPIPPAHILRKWIEESNQYEIDRAKFEACRTRPAFCLRCGNENIVVPDSIWSNLPHSTCGGTLLCTLTIQGGTYIEPEAHKYSIDGVFLERGFRQGPFEGDIREELDLWWPEPA